jgi:hypothetical protein
MALSPFHIDNNTGNLLASAAVVDSSTLTLTPAHGAVAGSLIVLREATHHYIGFVLSEALNVATMDTPLDHAYTTSADVSIGSANLNVDGATAVKYAHVTPPIGEKWDVTRVHIRMTDASEMDSAKFGGISALTKGMVLRKKGAVYKNIANVKTNGDLSMMSSDYEYDPKAPASVYGFMSKHVFGGQDHVGVVIRLDGGSSDELEIIIQDDLDDLTSLSAFAIGHVVTG